MRSSQGWPVSAGRTFVLFQALPVLAAGLNFDGWVAEPRQLQNPVNSTASTISTTSNTAPASIPVSSSVDSIVEPEPSSESEPAQTTEEKEEPTSVIPPEESSQEPSEVIESSTEASSVITPPPSATTPAPGDATIITEEKVDEEGNTVMVPVIIGGEGDPITLDPVTTTLTGEEAEQTIAEAKEQVENLGPVIDEWKEDPEGKQEETQNEVDGVQAGVLGAIGGLGAVAAAPAVMGLAGIASQMGQVSSGVAAGAAGVPAVSSAMSGISSSVGNLPIGGGAGGGGGGGGGGGEGGDGNGDGNENEDGDDNEENDEDDEEQSSVSQSVSETASSTELSSTETTAEESTTEVTTTESPSSTATENPPSLCAPENCGDSCAGGGGGGGALSKSMEPTGSVECALVSTTTTDTLPTESDAMIEVQGIEQPPERDSEISSPLEAKRGWTASAWGAVDTATGLVKRVMADVPMQDRVIHVSSLMPVLINQGVPASAEYYDFPAGGGVDVVGVGGLYGCTSVIIVSTRGVYLSHIWEIPVFKERSQNGQYSRTETDDRTFRREGFRILRDGNSDAISLRGLVGTDAFPGPLHSKYSPRIYVVTPYTNAYERSQGITTQLRYLDRARQLGRWVSREIPGDPGAAIIGYTRTNRDESTDIGFYGRALIEVDPYQRWMAIPNDPFGRGIQVGRWRLWVEDTIVTTQEYWSTDSFARKRQEIGHENPCGDEGGDEDDGEGDGEEQASSSEAPAPIPTPEPSTSEEPTTEPTTIPEETTAAPEEPTSEEEPTTVPEETTTAPQESTSEETTSIPDETTTEQPTSSEEPTSTVPSSTEATTTEATTDEKPTAPGVPTMTEPYTYRTKENDYGPTYIVVCEKGAESAVPPFGLLTCLTPSETISTQPPKRTGDRESCRMEGHEANYWDCGPFSCDSAGGVTESNLMVLSEEDQEDGWESDGVSFEPKSDYDVIWESDRASVETKEDGPVHDLDYGEGHVQESIEFTWAVEGDYCACKIDGEDKDGEFERFEMESDVHFVCRCDFDCHLT